MDHAEAHERIGDLAVDPTGLSALEMALGPETADLLEHVAGCPTCRAELDAWRRLHGALGTALAGTAAGAGDPAGLAAVEPIRAPDALRSAIIGITRSPAYGPDLASVDAAPSAAVRSAAEVEVRSGPARWTMPAFLGRSRFGLGLAAALVIVVVGAGVLVDQAGRLATARDEAQALAGVTQTLDRLLASGEARVVVLRRVDGTSAGSISWSTRDLVVLTTALAPPPAGRVYRCWLEGASGRIAIGQMEFAGASAYWVGSLDEWSSIDLGSNGRFGVSLEPSAGGVGGAAVLIGDLGA